MKRIRRSKLEIAKAKKIILQGIKEGMTISEAVKIAGYKSDSILYLFLKEDRRFKMQYDKITPIAHKPAFRRTKARIKDLKWKSILLFEQGLNDMQVAKELGYGSYTIINLWRRRDQQYKEQYEKAKVIAEQGLFNDHHVEQLTGQKPKTLEAIAEKTTRPLTASDIESTEHYKALKDENERLQRELNYTNEDYDRVKNSVGMLNEVVDKNHDLHRKLSRALSLLQERKDEIAKLKSKDNSLWLKWLTFGYGLAGLYAIYHIVSEVLK